MGPARAEAWRRAPAGSGAPRRLGGGALRRLAPVADALNSSVASGEPGAQPHTCADHFRAQSSTNCLPSLPSLPAGRLAGPAPAPATLVELGERHRGRRLAVAAAGGLVVELVEAGVLARVGARVGGAPGRPGQREGRSRGRAPLLLDGHVGQLGARGIGRLRARARPPAWLRPPGHASTGGAQPLGGLVHAEQVARGRAGTPRAT